jgi:hypothetical protein
MKFRTLRRTALCAVVGFALLGSAGCGIGHEKLKRREVIGSWSGDGNGRVKFSPDGRFEMSGIPRSAIDFSFIKPPPGNGPISGKGDWEMDHGSPSSSLTLSFEAGGSFSDDSEVSGLRVIDSGDHPTMYFDINPDKEYGYEIRRVGK